MLEATIRKIHRTAGIYVVGFLAIQTLTGLFIALGTLMGTSREPFWFAAMAWIHHNWDPVGSAYRILLGALVVGQGLGGVAIYLLMRARQKKTP
jgi:hypothetical protein